MAIRIHNLEGYFYNGYNGLMASVAKHVAHTLGVGKVMGSMLGPNGVIAKDVINACMSDARH